MRRHINAEPLQLSFATDVLSCEEGKYAVQTPLDFVDGAKELCRSTVGFDYS